MADRLRVLLVLSHPVQYESPLFRRYATEPGLDITVAYCSMRGAESASDPDFALDVHWDVPLLEGYRWLHVQGRDGRLTRKTLGAWNPRLWHLIRGGGFDVVVCYGYRTASSWIAAAAARASASRLMWVIDAITIQPRDAASAWWKVPIKRVILPLILRAADGVIAPSSRTVEFLRRIGTSGPRVHLVPYVVDNELFERLSAETDPVMVRKGWGVPTDSFVATFVGKQVPWKRPQDLLDAVALVPGAFAVFAGNGPLRERLALRAKQMGVADRVRFIGFVNQSALPAVYRASDVLVLPSEFEPFGLVINESFASGTPAIVSSACGAVGDLIRDNETGFAYPSRDVVALSERIRRLAQSPGLRNHLADGARARIRKWGVEENTIAFSRAIHAIVGAS